MLLTTTDRGRKRGVGRLEVAHDVRGQLLFGVLLFGDLLVNDLLVGVVLALGFLLVGGLAGGLAVLAVLAVGGVVLIVVASGGARIAVVGAILREPLVQGGRDGTIQSRASQKAYLFEKCFAEGRTLWPSPKKPWVLRVTLGNLGPPG